MVFVKIFIQFLYVFLDRSIDSIWTDASSFFYSWSLKGAGLFVSPEGCRLENPAPMRVFQPIPLTFSCGNVSCTIAPTNSVLHIIRPSSNGRYHIEYLQDCENKSLQTKTGNLLLQSFVTNCNWTRSKLYCIHLYPSRKYTARNTINQTIEFANLVPNMLVGVGRATWWRWNIWVIALARGPWW
mgnify:CR=1 FL=1